MFMQKKLIRWILSPLNKRIKTIPQKVRDILFVLGGIGLAVHCILWGARLVPYRFLVFFPISCIFMGLMILGSLGQELTPVRFRPSVFVPWLACGVGMLVSGLINNTNYLPDALLFLVAFPVLYICWANSDREKIFKKLILINKLTLITFLTASFLFIQITSKKYPAFSINVNTASIFLAVSSVFIFIELISEKKFSKTIILDIILLGAATAVNYYTNSRTGPLALICAAFFVLILYFITNSRKDSLFTLGKLGVFAVTAAVMTTGLLYVFQLRQWIPLPYIDLQNQTVYTDDRWKSLWEKETPTDTETDPDSAEKNPPNKDFFGNDGYKDINEQKLDTDRTADSFSTGRISVWKTYAKDLNFRGHSTTPTIYVELLKRDISSTHMTILQVAYESGIPAGIFYLCFNIASGILAIIFAVRNRKEKYALLPLAVILVFGAISMLASTRVAFWNYNTLMYYLMLFPLMTKTVSKENGHETK